MTFKHLPRIEFGPRQFWLAGVVTSQRGIQLEVLLEISYQHEVCGVYLRPPGANADNLIAPSSLLARHHRRPRREAALCIEAIRSYMRCLSIADVAARARVAVQVFFNTGLFGDAVTAKQLGSASRLPGLSTRSREFITIQSLFVDGGRFQATPEVVEGQREALIEVLTLQHQLNQE